MSEDIAAFVSARLDEDEAAAKNAPSELDDGQWPFWIEFTSTDEPGVEAAQAYRDRFPPARALRDVEADRKLLREYQSAASVRGGDWTEGEAGRADGLEAGLLLAVKIRAERFSGHSDYRGEWKP